MKVESGDTPRIPEMKDEHLVVSADPIVEEQLKHGWQVLKEYREALRALAK